MLQISHFKRLTREHDIHNYLSFGYFYWYVLTDKKVAKWNNCEFYVLLLIFKTLKFVTESKLGSPIKLLKW